MLVKSNKKEITLFTLYFLGWWMYFTQGVLGIRGIISQILLTVMIFWSMACYYKVVVSRNQNQILKSLNYLLILFVIYGCSQLLFTTDSGVGTRALDYVKKTLFSILPIWGYYYYFKRIDISEKWLMFIITMLLLYGIGEHVDGVRNMEQKIMEGTVIRSTDEMVISAAYRLVPLFPLLFFIKKNEWFKYCAILIILVIAILGVKRGPIIICAIATIICLWDNLTLTSLRKLRFSHILILLIAISGGYIILSRMIEGNEFLIYRLEAMLEGDSSGRDDIYSSYYKFIVSETNVFLLIFGHGADSTVKLLGSYAHNDWLEIGVNQGLFGVTLYLNYFIQLIKQWKKVKISHDLYMCIGVFIVVSIITSVLSMSINNQRISSHICIAFFIFMSENLFASNIKFKKTL